MKNIDETIENYLIGTIAGAYKTKRYWMDKRFDEKSAIEKSVKYAIGQMESSIGNTLSWKNVESIFREISVISDSLADYCKHVDD